MSVKEVLLPAEERFERVRNRAEVICNVSKRGAFAG